MTLTNIHSREIETAFSLYKQADASTPLTASNVDKKLAYRSFAPANGEIPASVGDASWYGKGDNFGSFWSPIQRQVVLPSRQYSMTDLAALWAFAFTMGKDTVTQPDSAGAPSVYDHAIEFQDVESEIECKYTSILQKFGLLWEDLITGLVLQQCSIEGSADDHVSLSWQGVARNKATSAQALPAISSTGGFFNFRRSTCSFGAQASPAAIGAQLTNFQITANQNPNIRRNAAASAGQETYFSKALVGLQRFTGSITLDALDSDLRNLFDNNTECSLTLVCIGAQIGATAYYRQVTIYVPHLYIPAFNLGEDGDITNVQIPFNEETVIKSGSDPYARVTIRTTIDDSAILEEEP